MRDRVLATRTGARDAAPPAMTIDGRPARVLFVVNEDWMFWSHRLSLARAVRDAGGEVAVATRVGKHGERIVREGFRLHELRWNRGSRSIVRESRALFALLKIYRDERPDLVHHVGIKSVMYGGLVSLFSRPPAQVHTLAGFGYVSTSAQARARVLRALVRTAFRRLLNRKHSHLVVQNPDDETEIVSGRLFDRSRLHLIRGSGVDSDHFGRMEEPEGTVTAALVSRLVRSKGVVELADAARILRKRRCDIRIVLVGDPDTENPETVTHEMLAGWVNEGILEWVGVVDDVRSVWERAHIGVLPSYREGLPRTLLEAASCGRALVAADVPGCREIVRHDENGLLVPVRDASRLADALEELVRNGDRRRAMGEKSRERVTLLYSDHIILDEMLTLYRQAIDARETRG